MKVTGRLFPAATGAAILAAAMLAPAILTTGSAAAQTAPQRTGATAPDAPADAAPGKKGGLGSGFQRDNDQPINVAADSLEVAQDQKTATLVGNVVIVQGELRLKGDKVIIHYRAREAAPGTKPAPAPPPDATNPGGGSNEISRLEAMGKVFISSPTETAQGDWADYDVVTGLVKMGGAVVLTKGQNVLKGNALALDLNTGRSRLTAPAGGNGGRVQGLFIPQKREKKPAP